MKNPMNILSDKWRRADIAMHRYLLEKPHKAVFWTFETGNLVEILKDGDIGGLFRDVRHESLYEDASAISFVSGSYFAGLKEKHPAYFTFGMTLMAVGGAALAASGATTAGIAVAWASLDAARGGYFIMEEAISTGNKKPNTLAHKGLRLFERATRFIDFPTTLMEKAEARIEQSSTRLADKILPVTDAWKRPFARQLMIKGPSRVVFIFGSAAAGDVGGVVAGSLWLGGDVSLAHMDPKIASYHRRILEEKMRKAGIANDPDESLDV